MSGIHERPSSWVGVSRVLPDGSVATPKDPGIIKRTAPTHEEVVAFQNGLKTGDISPLFPVKKKDDGGLCKPVIPEQMGPMTPKQIHERALVEEGESMRAVTERLLHAGVSEVVFNSGK